jgi:hypothetical protein
MESLFEDSKRVNHLAGVVPIAGMPLDFNMPWSDCLLPIAPDYLAVEKAVYECAVAGCETIWIVGHLGMEPLIRQRVGDYILDPMSVKMFEYRKILSKIRSIYYVPIHPKDRDKRDSLGWSVLYGADSAFRVGAFISKWLVPDKFFCSFPYGITPEKTIQENRIKISSRENVLFTHNGKSVKDGLHLNFTFGAEDYKRCRDIVKHKEFSEPRDKKTNNYTLQQVFSGLDTQNASVVDCPWFHDVSNWEGYRKYMASEESFQIKKDTYMFLKRKRVKFPKEKDIHEKDKRVRIDVQQPLPSD